MTGLEGRTSLLVNLADALKGNTEYFGPDARPGNLIGKHSLISFFFMSFWLKYLHRFPREEFPDFVL